MAKFWKSNLIIWSHWTKTVGCANVSMIVKYLPVSFFLPWIHFTIGCTLYRIDRKTRDSKCQIQNFPHKAILYILLLFLKNLGQPWPLFVYFSSFSSVKEETVGFSRDSNLDRRKASTLTTCPPPRHNILLLQFNNFLRNIFNILKISHPSIHPYGPVDW